MCKNISFYQQLLCKRSQSPKFKLCLSTTKKILSPLIKIALGLATFSVIYYRLKPEFTAQNMQLLSAQVLSLKGALCLLGAVLLIPINWGIEAYKWKLITAPVQRISFFRANQSVYSGVCLGNLAPGRATEFLAKIIYFDADKRSSVTVLHFIGGLFQLSITILCGFLAMYSQLHVLGEKLAWMQVVLPILGLLLLIALVLSIWRINWLLQFVTKRILKNQATDAFNYQFSAGQVLQLFFFSFLRYGIFFLQFYLLLSLLSDNSLLSIVPGIALYFLITTILPMFSAIEAAVRAAVALVVFKESGMAATGLALSSVLLWIINIIVPSGIGYIFLVREKFDFKLVRKKQKA